MSNSNERERRLDEIRKHADKLSAVADQYQGLRWLAEEEKSTDMFLGLAEAAGVLAVHSLGQLSAAMDILYRAKERL